MRMRLAILVSTAVVIVLLFFLWRTRKAQPSPGAPGPTQSAVLLSNGTITPSDASTDVSPTNVYAHNLLLRKGPNFRVYVRWLRGQIRRTRRGDNPSFDDPESFFLYIKTGVVRANIGDIGGFINANGMGNSPLKNIHLSADGDQIKMTGMLHKVVPLPIEIVGTPSATPDNRIRIHITKLDVLKIPMKGLLGDFHVKLADLFHPTGVAGLEISGNDILIDTQQAMPPPHIRGQLTKVRVASPDLEEVFGNAEQDVQRVEEWRNFLRLRDGTLDFGKLTMHHVDLIMIDISKDAWFDLDLAHYQDQIVNGYTRMTPQAGLQIFMPDMGKLPRTKVTEDISMEWLKNRNLPPPADVLVKR